MTKSNDLFPELAAWNHGRGIEPRNWLHLYARSDITTALCMLIWPNFVVFQGCIFREDFSKAFFEERKKTPNVSQQQLEESVNIVVLEDLLASEKWTPTVEARSVYLVRAFAAAHRAKLEQDFPDRTFEVSVQDSLEGGDISFSFWQT